MPSEVQDLLREHWRSRRDRILDELRGMGAALESVPFTPAGQEVRAIIEDKAQDLRAQLEKLERYLGVRDTIHK